MTAPGRRARTSGSGLSLPASGIGGGPSGRPLTTDFSPTSAFGFAASAALLPAVLEGALLDPELESGELGVGELVAARRHVRLVLVGRQSEEPRLVRVAGLDDGARTAALHRRGEGGEVEPALLLLGAVAADAGLLEDRQDVVGVASASRGRRKPAAHGRRAARA